MCNSLFSNMHHTYIKSNYEFYEHTFTSAVINICNLHVLMAEDGTVERVYVLLSCTICAVCMSVSRAANGVACSTLRWPTLKLLALLSVSLVQLVTVNGPSTCCKRLMTFSSVFTFLTNLGRNIFIGKMSKSFRT